MIKVYVMQTCPDCADIKDQLREDPRYEVIDIGEHVRNLKQFLTLRDNNPAFAPIKERGSIGIPCFVDEEENVAFSQGQLQSVSERKSEGMSCGIDGKGC